MQTANVDHSRDDDESDLDTRVKVGLAEHAAAVCDMVACFGALH